jgi:hypothetical protein
MLHLLPFELLTIIFDLASPTCTSAYYDDRLTRTQDICAFSTVCRATRRPAQRLARREVFLEGDERVDDLRRCLWVVGARDEVLVVRAVEGVSVEALNKLLDRLPRVLEVQLIDIGHSVQLDTLRLPPCTSQLRPHPPPPDLKRLDRDARTAVTTFALKNLELSLSFPLHPVVSFPHLTNLIIHNVNLRRTPVASFLSAATFPSLTALAMTGVNSFLPGGLFFHNLAPPLLDRFQVIQGIAISATTSPALSLV